VNLFREAHKHFQLPEAYAYAINTYGNILYTASWLLTPEQKATLPYVGLENDLTALLRVQASHNWVTVFLWTAGQADLTLNCIHSSSSTARATTTSRMRSTTSAWPRASASTCPATTPPAFWHVRLR
jgi:hypothetical protein